jgi:glutathione S-transferase
MLTLYHYDRSTASQRVRLALEEKEIPWTSIIVVTARGDAENLPEDYHRLNPKGLVPVIIHDGAAIPESLVILDYLDDVFPEKPLRPTAAVERAQMRLWMRKIDESVHVASRVVGVCVVNRHIYKEKGAGKIDEYYAAMKDGVRRNNDLLNIKYGLESPLLPDAVRTFRRLFEDMNMWLSERPWLAGESYSLADVALVVYVRRLESFMMAPLWAHLESLNGWYARIAERPAYARSIVGWGDVTGKDRTIHGTEAFPRLEQIWNERP